VLAHFAAHPGATKRDLAKALGVRGEDRQALKRLLKELADEGLIQRGKKKSFSKPGALPPVTIVEITGTDADGDLFGRPARWEGDGEPPQILIIPGREEAGGALAPGERVLARISQEKDGFEARIIKRLGANAQRVLGVLKRDGPNVHIEPIDRKSRYGFIVDASEVKEIPDGELVAVEPLSGRRSGLPRAKISERLGSLNEPKMVSLIAIHAHGIPVAFSSETIVEAESAKPVNSKGRTDLREIPLITIDPEDARDHDDAVWAGPDPDKSNPGGHIVIVAIADVAHYVRPGSMLDREAYTRGNSVYFPDRVVPMLPEALSTDLCSLREGEDRAALAVRMHFDAQGVKRHHKFERVFMRSAARLSYADAQSAFDGKPNERTKPIATKIMAPLWAAYMAVAKARDKRGPLDLDLPERRVILDEKGNVSSIAIRERLESMRLVEEFMIQANVAAAETLEKARQPVLYRVHEKPSFEKLTAFADYLRAISLSFTKGQIVKPAAFNRILARAKGTPNEEVMNEIVLRSQSQAIYAPDNVGHFGLNLMRYAHFTSPIRRYADLIVHRALVAGLNLGEGGLSPREASQISKIAAHISITERRAMAAERDSVERYVAAYMEDRVGTVFNARIASVTRFGLFVRLAETGADGILPMRALGAERIRHDQKRQALIGERTRTTYLLGDIVKVRLAEAAPLTGGLRFELFGENGGDHGKILPPVRKSRSRPRSKKSR
jgi:ribonuclease R